jgi:hypothetical protein
MGVDWGDYDRDGVLDLVVSNFANAPFELHRNMGIGVFEHAGYRTGMARATLVRLGFGAKWGDFDNDGWTDVIFANGHIYDLPPTEEKLVGFRQRLIMLHTRPGHRPGQQPRPEDRHFTDLMPQMGADLNQPILGRGLASGDYDNDGRMDFLTIDLEGLPLLLHNESQTRNHWITFDLRRSVNDHRADPSAYGAQIVARAGKSLWVGQVSPASSYLSSSDPRVHFGLGKVQQLDSVTIKWPSGKRKLLRNVRVDRILKVEE